MRLITLTLAIALCFSQISCQTGKKVLATCPSATVLNEPGLEGTPITRAEYHDVLTQYFTNRSKVEYDACIRTSTSRFTGRIVWTRDGADRERFDLSPTDGSIPISYVASRGQSYLCSSDLGKYIARMFDGADQKYRDAIQPFAASGSGCMPDPYPTSSCYRRCVDEDVIDGLGVPNPLTIDLVAFQTTALLGPTYTKYDRQIAGLHATCYTPVTKCFADDGTLLSSRSGDSVLEAKSVSHDVSDPDFSLPYGLRPGPQTAPADRSGTP